MTKTKEKFKIEACNSFAVGTCLRGYVKANYSDIVAVLGEPDPDNTDGYKVDAEWIFKINGKVMTIYNYKTGKNYLGKNGMDKEDIINWHIGASFEQDTTEEQKFLAEQIKGQLVEKNY